MRNIGAFFAAAALIATSTDLRAAEKTWTGTLVDTRCSAKIAASGPRTSSQMDGDHACAVKCVAGGERHAFVSNGKVYEIANQGFKGLTDNEGYRVELTGEMKGGHITVSRIRRKAAEE